MKHFTFFFLALFTYCSSQAQEPPILSTDTNWYVLYADVMYPELQIEVNGKWKAYNLFSSDPIGSFSFEIDEIDLNKDSIPELFIYWKDESYGAGGGMYLKGLQIWDLKNGKRLLTTIIETREEFFGEDNLNQYQISCEVKIEAGQNLLEAKALKCSGTWSTEIPFEVMEKVQNQAFLETGKYTFNEKKGYLEKVE